MKEPVVSAKQQATRFHKPRKIPKAELERKAREIQGNVSVIESLSLAVTRNNEFIDDGVGGMDYSAVRRGGSTGSATENAALARSDDRIGPRMYELANEMDTLLRSSRRARDLAEMLSVDWSKEKREAASEIANRANLSGAQVQTCVNCARTVAGTPQDKLRKARCQECYRYWDRHGRITERPRDMWDRGQCVATRLVPGEGEYECELPQDHPQESEGDHMWVAVLARAG